MILRTVGPRNGVRQSISDPNIASRRVLQRRELAAAGLACRDLGCIPRFDPVEPVRPPGTRMLLGLCEPPVEIGAGWFWSGPVLVLHLVGGIDDAGNVTRAGQHETHLPAVELRTEQY